MIIIKNDLKISNKEMNELNVRHRNEMQLIQTKYESLMQSNKQAHDVNDNMSGLNIQLSESNKSVMKENNILRNKVNSLKV